MITTPSASDSGLNLDHLGACPFCGSTNIDAEAWTGNSGKSGPGCDDCGALAETAADWNRRAAPVSAPIAGNALVQELLEYAGNSGYSHNDYADIMRRAAAALANQPAPTRLSKDEIRAVFLANGFTVKEGQTDLKPYVYAAAEALLSRANQPAPTAAPEQVAGAHHLEPAAIQATINDLRKIESGTPVVAVQDRDWRTWAGVLARTIEHLFASQPSEVAPLAVPGLWVQHIDGVKTQNVARDAAEKAMVESIHRTMAPGTTMTWQALYAAPSLPAAAPAMTVPAEYALDVEKLQRYAPDRSGMNMEPCHDGAYVLLSDVQDAAYALAHQPAQEQAFPERDPSKPAEQQGLFRKFDVRRVDGSDQPGGKHHGCRYYVLDLTHDQHAPAAMRAYATACRITHPQLAADIEAEFGAAQEQAGIPELSKAFMTLESNGGEGRTIVLKFNQRDDAYAVHDYLLKAGSQDYRHGDSQAAQHEAGDERLLGLLAEASATLKTFADVAPAVSLIRDIDAVLAASPVVRAQSEESGQQKPLAPGHRDDFYLLANGRRLGLEPISRVRHMPNWVLASELFATGSTSAHQICRDAGVDPDSCTTERAAIRAA